MNGRTFLSGLGSSLAGILVWAGLYCALSQAISEEPLSSQEEVAFKAFYILIAVVGVLLAFWLSWLFAPSDTSSKVLSVILVAIFIAVVIYPLAQGTSVANECNVGLAWPVSVGGCD
ncbi:MAG: hypothetical protein A2113_02090 [Candidatus Woykebacteria bacterium GWA1_44_8]|uniref:Uncharacterized protein n=1 Tax=Candidatus Woykebacteria bacterium GWA1_44_8 TaxID=1802591 RepID=A0A1G1VZT5_9BACT|nr:MAG: hypothetical protein A2113_02090 [Candidatus Woykebacteria bacterium GWA1_44_8]